MGVRTLEHLDLLAGQLPPPGPFPGWFANGTFAVGDEVLAENALQDCAVAPSRIAVVLDLPAGAATVPDPPLTVIVPCPGGLMCTTLHALRGGPRHFVAAAPAFWTWSNRRMAHRVPLNQASRAEKDGTPLEALLLDVSISGGRVRLPVPHDQLEPGTRLWTVLPILGEPCVDAEVVRVHGAGDGTATCGVRWLGLPANVDQRLANFVFAHERAALKGTKRP